MGAKHRCGQKRAAPHRICTILKNRARATNEMKVLPKVVRSELLCAVDPRGCLGGHLQGGTRPDGRELLRGRKLAAHGAELSSSHASLMLRLGRTAVMAGVQCELTRPVESEATCGRVIVSLELPPACSAAVAVARGGGDRSRLEREQAALVELLQRTAADGLLCPEPLCAVEGLAVWTIRCKIVVLEHDGNLADAALLAMVHVMPSVRLPRVVVDEGGEEGAPPLLMLAEEDAVPIELARPVYPCSFRLLLGHVMLDPTAEEEALSSAALTLLLDGEAQVTSVHKPGGGPLPAGALDSCKVAAVARLPSITAALSGADAHPRLGDRVLN